MEAYTDKVYNVTMYTMANCEFCEMAKNLLYSHKDYVIYEVDLTSKPSVKQNVKEKLGTTVPQIVIDGVHIGGYKELQEYFDRWK